MTRQAVYCPGCGRRYVLTAETFAQAGLRLLCGSCEHVFDPRAVPFTTDEQQALIGAPSLLVAHESPSVCATVGRVARSAGFVPRYVHSGATVIAAFDRSLLERPMALVLDVGIPEILAFDVVAALRESQETEALPIILLASVFDPTRYKRRPSSLHGANAYLELHHVPDRLPSLLAQLCGLAGGDLPYRGHLPHEHARAEALRLGDISGDDGARIEARRIVSDIVLYSEDLIVAALREGDLRGRMLPVLEQGRELFQRATAQIDGVHGDPYAEAVEDMITALHERSLSET